MGRKRADTPEWLPKGIIVRHGWYVYREYLGRESGKTHFSPETRILPTNCTPAQFFIAFDAITKIKTVRTLRWLLEKYNQSQKFKRRALSTQQHYLAYFEKLCSTPIKTATGKRLLLGDIPIDQLTKPKLQRYVDNDPSPVAVNRRMQYLSSAWSWAENRYENMPPNPCIGLELREETPRSRYIEDWEYAVAYLCAASMRNPIYAPAMELAYLCRARRGEVFSYTDKDIFEDGLYLKRSKGSIPEITKWSPRLLAALEFCRAIYPDAPTPIKGRFLLHTSKGLKYTKNALDSAWQRVVEKAKTTGAILPPKLAGEARAQGARVDDDNRTYLLANDPEPFTFHDIKPKGKTDHDDEAAGGHKSRKMDAVYQRKPVTRDATR